MRVERSIGSSLGLWITELFKCLDEFSDMWSDPRIAVAVLQRGRVAEVGP
jgi:hypothetical protein